MEHAANMDRRIHYELNKQFIVRNEFVIELVQRFPRILNGEVS